MKFQEIFNQPGLYVCESLRDGFAFEVFKPEFQTNVKDLEIRMRHHTEGATFPTYSEFVMNSKYFNREFVQIYNTFDLFGERRKNLFKFV